MKLRCAVVMLLCAGSGACSDTEPPASDGRIPVWLDLSPAIGDPPRDPGDALALLQAYGSGRLLVRGVSVTFGNVPLERGYPAAQELLQRFDSGLRRAWRGPSTAEERVAPTEASELLREALQEQSLSIVAAGPATTMASVLLRQPTMAARIERVIMVAGTRADPTRPSATTDGAADANTLADAGSIQVLLDTAVPITLIAPGGGPQSDLDSSALDRLDAGRGPVKLITPSARGWLQDVGRRGGASAFPIPALLAVDVAAHPGAIRCEPAVATLVASGPGGPRLLVTAGPAGRAVTWCDSADAAARDRIIGDVLRLRPLPR